MNIQVTVKSPSRRRSSLMNQTIALVGEPATLQELLTMLVQSSVKAFIERQNTSSILPYLTEQEVQQSAETGKIGFGHVEDTRTPDEQQAIEAALLAFKDGLYRVFLRDEELTELTAPLSLQENDTLVFIRLTMLAGRLW